MSFNMHMFNSTFLSGLVSCDLSCIYQATLSVLPPTSNPPSTALEQRGELKLHIPLLIHLACVVPAFFIAFPLMRAKKGTKAHRVLGKLFMSLMTVGVGVTYGIKLLRRQDESQGVYNGRRAEGATKTNHRSSTDFLCRLSPSFAPGMLCKFSLFHLGTTITLSHIFLSIIAVKRGDIRAHQKWTFWVVVSVVVGGPLLPRERLTGMWLRGENPAWQPVDVFHKVQDLVQDMVHDEVEKIKDMLINV